MLYFKTNFKLFCAVSLLPIILFASLPCCPQGLIGQRLRQRLNGNNASFSKQNTAQDTTKAKTKNYKKTIIGGLDVAVWEPAA